MTMAAAIGTISAARAIEDRVIADVRIVDDLPAARAVWEELEHSGALMTAFQSYALLEAWQRHVGVERGFVPCIVVARDFQHQPVCVIPLCIERRNGVRVARFMGGKHTTFNMPLWRKDMASVSTKDIAAILDALRDQGIDTLELVQQPKSWRGTPNPFAMLPSQPSVNPCLVMTLPAGAAPNTLISRTFRRRLRVKERRLRELPNYRSIVAETDDDVELLLESFFTVKPQRMAAQKLPNVYQERGVEAFIREICFRRRPGGERVVAIHAIVADGQMMSMSAGVSDGQRCSMMFNTYTMSAYAKFSPGQVLLRDIVDHYAAQKYQSIDLGVGGDAYKTLFCKDDEPIFDSYVALSKKGWLIAPLGAARARMKSAVKRSKVLSMIAGRMRMVAGL